MFKRIITYACRDDKGRITALGNRRSAWSPRSVTDLIDDIESKSCRYFVRVGFNKIALVVLYIKGNKKLATDPSITDLDALDMLPDY